MSNITARSGVGVSVVPENRLFCPLDNLTPAAREFQRFKALTNLGLLKAETVPIFEEATQTVAHFLDIPTCILGVMTQERQWLKSAVGLSRLGLMNQLAAKRQMPRRETYCTYVVETKQVLAINNIAKNRFFAKSLLFQEYGIRTYLGAPLLTASEHCLGTLAVMDLVPRNFTKKEIDFLVLMARWAMSEVERNFLLKGQGTASVYVDSKSTPPEQNPHLPNQMSTPTIKVKLLSQLSEELRTPLTSVMGMTSVLNREIYGPLSSKQKEYVDIIHYSGQHLVDLVDEILTLGVLDESSQQLDLRYVDIEMICQQAIKSLEKIALARQQHIRLSVEPENRIWLLDKDKVRQMLYYLIFGMIQSASAGCVVRVDVSRKSERLNIALWLSDSWQSDYLTELEFYSHSEVCVASNGEAAELSLDSPEIISIAHEVGDSVLHPQQNHYNSRSLESSLPPPPKLLLSPSALRVALATPVDFTQKSDVVCHSRESLGILLSCELAELHGGQISVEDSPEAGYSYVVSLPQMIKADEDLQ